MGGVLRQGLRALAIYFTDVVLWLSVAGLVEVLLVIGAGVLCILTAGFIFEGMKRSPVVLVLGSIVALGGTFLMFREVRGLIWPTDDTVAEQHESGETPPAAPPTASLPPATPPAFGTPKIGQPILRPPAGTSLSGMAGSYCDRITSGEPCKAMAGCVWSEIFDRCTSRFGTSSACGSHSKLVCSAMSSCYWSPISERCETLRFRGLLGLDAVQPKPSPVRSCLEIRSAAVCTTTNGCTWSSGSCLFEVSPPKP
jgi:hypothetical protein